MMQYIFISIFLFFTLNVNAQSERKIVRKIYKFQKELNLEFLDPKTTILDSLGQLSFEGLEFYPVTTKYRIKASFKRTPNEKPFLMKTSTDRLPEYVKYGEASFEIEDEKIILNIYQNIKYSKIEEYKDDLFLPFTDYTSGDGSYGGGRYIDLKIPDNEFIILDFNKSYNPYCAYNKKYSCPIPPIENDIVLRIEAGIKDFSEH
ncbi:MAG: DUF1684 domain-containing protein [Flavobacteriales bacterium]|nr:MAG: DUF1684 domain-containing protein [Flavobacteriales bacterium]